MGVRLYGRASLWPCVSMGVRLYGRASLWPCVSMGVRLYGRASLRQWRRTQCVSTILATRHIHIPQNLRCAIQFKIMPLRFNRHRFDNRLFKWPDIARISAYHAPQIDRMFLP